MAEHEYEHHEFVEQDEDQDLEQEVYNLQMTVDTVLELLIEKNVFSESEFEKKFDELCEEEDDDSEEEEGDDEE